MKFKFGEIWVCGIKGVSVNFYVSKAFSEEEAKQYAYLCLKKNGFNVKPDDIWISKSSILEGVVLE
jgi:hypothetical protein